MLDALLLLMHIWPMLSGLTNDLILSVNPSQAWFEPHMSMAQSCHEDNASTTLVAHLNIFLNMTKILIACTK